MNVKWILRVSYCSVNNQNRFGKKCGAEINDHRDMLHSARSRSVRSSVSCLSRTKATIMSGLTLLTATKETPLALLTGVSNASMFTILRNIQLLMLIFVRHEKYGFPLPLHSHETLLCKFDRCCKFADLCKYGLSNICLKHKQTLINIYWKLLRNCQNCHVLDVTHRILCDWRKNTRKIKACFPRAKLSPP